MRTVLVVPCHNEAARLDPEGFRTLRGGGLRLLFVDDGSTDATAERLAELDAGDVLRLPARRGKAEAVRAGLREAVRDAEVVGFADADLSTPPAEIRRLLAAMKDGTDVVLGSRVAMMGRRIDRRPVRHWLGRVFATCAAAALDAPFYDTQCGAKLFRVSPLLVAALEEPFRAGWAFDVELLARLLGGTDEHTGLPLEAFVEVPLQEWRDVAGSKRTFGSAALAFAWLPAIAVALGRRRARAGRMAREPGR